MSATYSRVGVDVDIEEKAAKILYAAARRTWRNRSGKVGEVLTPFDDFSGLRAINVGGLPEGTLLNVGYDGVGTKAEFAERASRYDTLAFDLMAMVCDDAVIRGGEPIVVGSILDVNSLGTDDSRLEVIKQLARGYETAAAKAGVSVINGELAQLGYRIAGVGKTLHLSWGASVVWLAHESRMLTGHDVMPGHALIGLREPGLRSNGISLVRNLLIEKYGPDWHNPKHQLGGIPLIDLALRPSIIYTSALLDMTGGWDLGTTSRARLTAASHITGSGLPGKLARALKPAGLGAVIDNPWDPPALMLHCQEIGEVSDAEAYRTWHMGQGMVLATPEPHPVLAIARAHHLDAQVIGTVTEQPGIRIASRGLHADHEHWLDF
jgi:phosphoribosylformylglycinamidine cyclo-ligase